MEKSEQNSVNFYIIQPVCGEKREGQRLEKALTLVKKRIYESRGILTETVETAEKLRICLDEKRICGSRILFAVATGISGVNIEYYKMLRMLRILPGCLKGCTAAAVVDGGGEFYTKSVARELALAVNLAGACLIGSSLAEGTGSLNNLAVRAANMGKEAGEAYPEIILELMERLMDFCPAEKKNPELLCVHASSGIASNTLNLWNMVREGLEDACSVTEISLAEKNIRDCAGCSYHVCMDYAVLGQCLYNDCIVEEVYPALENCDALVMVCPNYNDALGAELTAFINRLTAFYRKRPFHDKYLFAVIVSGYSGGDIIAEQLAGSLNMNKAFVLPPDFCLTATANQPGDIFRVSGIRERAAEFAASIKECLCFQQ